MFQEEYNRQCRQTSERLVGKKVEGLKIIEIGLPIPENYNTPTLIPIKLSDGTFRVLWSEQGLEVLCSEKDEFNEAIRTSVQMPLVGPGLGSGVVHIQAYPQRDDCKHVFMKYYFNDKADRPDVVEYEPTQLVT